MIKRVMEHIIFSANKIDDEEISEDAARMLDNLDDITNAISDLAEMDSDKFALALRDRNVAGWWGRAWKKIKGFAHRVARGVVSFFGWSLLWNIFRFKQKYVK